MDDPAAHLDEVTAKLVAELVLPTEVPTRAPAVAGLYAWWAPPTVLPTLAGPPHPLQQDLRLLYVGITTRLRSRLASNHLRRSGSSTLRRTWRVSSSTKSIFGRAGPTAWSWSTTTRSGWVDHPDARALSLNVEHATGPNVDLIKAARRRYYQSAGTRPT